MSADFEKEITEIATMIEPDYKLAPETIPIAVESLEEIDNDYGPASDNLLPFHDAPHSVGVTRRGVRLANILYPYIRPLHRRRFFDLVIIDGATHDRRQDLGPIENEIASAEDAIQKVETADGILNTGIFKKRLVYGNLATAVRMEDGGKLVQVNLQRGAHDPIKFNMAFSDINGIAMEGNKRMWQDATNLYLEITDEPTDEGLCNFLIDQRKFLRERLNDGRIKSDIAYYFPDDIAAVYKDMRRAFHGNIVSSHGLAVLLGERPELQRSVARVAKAREALDRSGLGAIIGKMIRKKIEPDR
jgi:hypothetical protein